MTTPVLPKKLQAQIKWPDRSHRSLAEVWRLTDEEVEAEQFVDQRPHEWRKG